MTTQYIWKLYADDVKHFILSKVKNSSVAEDLVQETFIKIHIKLSNLKDASKLKSWIFSIARNTTLDYFKTTSKKINFSTDELSYEEETTTHTERDCLLAHIMNLDKKYRTPLFLSDIKGIKQIEIAKQLNIPLSTIKSRVQRARRKIAQGYIECCDYQLSEKGVLVGEHKEKEDCKICR
ncbi:MAG: sigma-70 family RNA polymerase sigma factor [Urechidicola sp.]|nr:sigma-70 family RNA polymerase sigma factor [Urechidicola sp.]